MTTSAELSDDTIVDHWSRLGIEPHTFELDANGTLQSRLHGSGRSGDTIIEALAPFERAQLALKGEIKLGREIGRGGLGVFVGVVRCGVWSLLVWCGVGVWCGAVCGVVCSSVWCGVCGVFLSAFRRSRGQCPSAVSEPTPSRSGQAESGGQGRVVGRTA